VLQEELLHRAFSLICPILVLLLEFKKTLPVSDSFPNHDLPCALVRVVPVAKLVVAISNGGPLQLLQIFFLEVAVRHFRATSKSQLMSLLKFNQFCNLVGVPVLSSRWVGSLDVLVVLRLGTSLIRCRVRLTRCYSFLLLCFTHPLELLVEVAWVVKLVLNGLVDFPTDRIASAESVVGPVFPLVEQVLHLLNHLDGKHHRIWLVIGKQPTILHEYVHGEVGHRGPLFLGSALEVPAPMGAWLRLNDMSGAHFGLQALLLLRIDLRHIVKV